MKNENEKIEEVEMKEERKDFFPEEQEFTVNGHDTKFKIKPYITFSEQRLIVSECYSIFKNGSIGEETDVETGDVVETLITDNVYGVDTNFMLMERQFDVMVALICAPELFDFLKYDQMKANGIFRQFQNMIVGYAEAKQALYTIMTQGESFENKIDLVANKLAETFGSKLIEEAAKSLGSGSLNMPKLTDNELSAFAELLKPQETKVK